MVKTYIYLFMLIVFIPSVLFSTSNDDKYKKLEGSDTGIFSMYSLSKFKMLGADLDTNSMVYGYKSNFRINNNMKLGLLTLGSGTKTYNYVINYGLIGPNFQIYYPVKQFYFAFELGLVTGGFRIERELLKNVDSSALIKRDSGFIYGTIPTGLIEWHFVPGYKAGCFASLIYASNLNASYILAPSFGIQFSIFTKLFD